MPNNLSRLNVISFCLNNTVIPGVRSGLLTDTELLNSAARSREPPASDEESVVQLTSALLKHVSWLHPVVNLVKAEFGHNTIEYRNTPYP